MKFDGNLGVTRVQPVTALEAGLKSLDPADGWIN